MHSCWWELLFVHYWNTLHFLLWVFFPSQIFLKCPRHSQVHHTHFQTSTKWSKDKDMEKGGRLQEGMTEKKEGVGGSVGEWVEENRGRKIERVIANDFCFYCSLALCRSGGSDRHSLFSCKSPFRKCPSQAHSETTSLPSTNLPPPPRVPHAFSILPHILSFPLLFYPHSSFT